MARANCLSSGAASDYGSLLGTVPAGTSIQFSAQSAETQEDLGAADSVSIGTAEESVTIWTSDTDTVNWHLENDLTPPSWSGRWLRISMTLNPKGKTSPSLDQWRQVFDCRKAE